MKSKLYGDTFDYSGLNEFIINVWNYYAGKINLVVPANLEVKYVCDPSAIVSGETYYPANVKIYPNIIIDKLDGNKNLVYIEIIETIIHELFHVDQFKINSNVLNPQYVRNIESQVEFMANSYILTNAEDIYNRFGVKMDIERNKENMYIYSRPFYIYDRVTPMDHILLGIDAILMDNNLAYPYMEHMIDIFNNTNKNIIYRINNNDIVIRNNGSVINLYDYNNMINSLWFKYNEFIYKKDNFILSEEDDNTYIIIFNSINNYYDFARVIAI